MSCDAELQELMVQVDRMVEEKKIEWQEKIKSIEVKLNNTLQENFTLKSIIEEKNNEISIIKSRIHHKENITTVLDYDQEVLQLRLELSQIKKSYEKNYHKYTKKTKEMEKDKEDMCREKIDLLKELNELKNLQNKFKEEQLRYQEQIKDFESKKTSILVDRDGLNEQLKLLKNDFTYQLNGYVESEKKYSLSIKELESQLVESKNQYLRETEKNTTKFNELMQQIKKLQDERQQLIIDNESAKRMIIRMENELGRFSSDNKIKEKTICKMDQVIKVNEKTISEKNEVIRALQVNSASKDYITIISKLENELMETKSQLKNNRKMEKSFQTDFQAMEKKLKDAQENIENYKNIKIQLDSSLEEITKSENEKINLLKKINSLEIIIENNVSEIESVKVQYEKLKIENERLIHQLKQEQISNELSAEIESKKKVDDDSENFRINQRTGNLLKERNYLLKFCEDKDLVIHRLQTENKILQDFISKLNSGLSDEPLFFNSELHFEHCTSASDVFQPLKETFTDFESSFHCDKTSSENANYKSFTSLHPPPTINKQLIEYSTESFPNISNSHRNLEDNINKCSEHFLNGLRSDAGDHKTVDKEFYMNLYSTIAAAKYFTNEREKSKEIEKMIDHHMNQLKKETSTRSSLSNR